MRVWLLILLLLTPVAIGASFVSFQNIPTANFFFPDEFFGETTFFGNVTIHGFLNIISGELFVSEVVLINGSNIPAIDDEFTLGNTTHRWEDLFISQNIFVDGTTVNSTFDGDLLVSGTVYGGSPVKFGDDIIVDGDGTFDNINLLNGDAQGNLVITGNLTVNGTTLINNDINVSGNINGSIDCINVINGNDANICDNIIPSTIVNGSLVVLEGLNATGNFSINGNLTADFFFGEMFHDVGSLIVTLTKNVAMNVSIPESGELNGFNFTNSSLIVGEAGRYQVTYSLSSVTTGGSATIQLEAAVNNVPQSKCSVLFSIGTNNPDGNSGTCIIRLNPNDQVVLVATNTKNNNNMDVSFVNFNLARIGNL